MKAQLFATVKVLADVPIARARKVAEMRMLEIILSVSNADDLANHDKGKASWFEDSFFENTWPFMPFRLPSVIKSDFSGLGKIKQHSTAKLLALYLTMCIPVVICASDGAGGIGTLICKNSSIFPRACVLDVSICLPGKTIIWLTSLPARNKHGCL